MKQALLKYYSKLKHYVRFPAPAVFVFVALNIQCFAQSPTIEKLEGYQDKLINLNYANHPDKFENTLDSVRSFHSKNPTAYGELIIRFFEANSKWGKTQNEEVLGDLVRVLHLADLEDTRHQSIAFHAYFLKGIIYRDLGDYKEAYKNYLRAAEISSKNGNPSYIATTHKVLGLILYNQYAYQHAREEFIKSLYYFSKASDTRHSRYNTQEVIDNIGLTYLKEGKHEMALLYFDSALSFINKYLPGINEPEEIDVARGVVYGNFARVYFNLGEFEKSIRYYLKGIELKSTMRQYEQDLLRDKIYLCEAYLAMNDFAKIGPLLNELEQNEEKLREYGLLHLFFKLKANYHHLKGSPGAFGFLQEYTRIKDSTFKANTEKNLANYLMAHKLQKEEEAVNTLRRQNKAQVVESRIYLVVAALLVVILVLGVFLYRSNLKANKKLKKLNSEITAQRDELNNKSLQLETLNEKLKSANKQKTAILGVVAHDLRNPLGSIISSVELIRLKYGKKLNGENEILRILEVLSNNALSIIDDLVYHAKHESTELELSREACDINEIVRGTVNMMKNTAQLKKITIEVKTDKKISAEVDRGKFQRIVQNLLSNAIKFSPRENCVSVKLADRGEKFDLVVSDNGIGMNKELQKELFKPFNKHKRKGTDGEATIGLGLSIVKELVDAHYGTIEVQSGENEGTSMTCGFPKKHLGTA